MKTSYISRKQVNTQSIGSNKLSYLKFLTHSSLDYRSELSQIVRNSTWKLTANMKLNIKIWYCFSCCYTRFHPLRCLHSGCFWIFRSGVFFSIYSWFLCLLIWDVWQRLNERPRFISSPVNRRSYRNVHVNGKNTVRCPKIFVGF